MPSRLLSTDPLTQALIGRMSPEEQTLRDLWNKQVITTDSKTGLPDPGPPPGFRAPPDVVPSLQGDYDRLRAIAPNLDNKVRQIRHNADDDSIAFSEKALKQPYDYNFPPRLLGTTSPKNNVTISPNLDSPATLPVLAHEMTHVSGYDDDTAYPAGDLFSQLLQRTH